MAEKALIAVIQSERLSLLYEAEIDVLAYISFRVPRAKLHSTNPLERVNGKIERRTEVAGIFSNEAAIIRLVLLSQKTAGS